jgi:hypothetical protein
MHFDTRLFVALIVLTSCFGRYSDDQSYLSLIEFNRGGISTNLILSSPHGGFLGLNVTFKTPLWQLPVAGCYNNTLERCVYTIQDCLRPNSHDSKKLSFHADARCVTDRSSTLAMYSLTKAIAETFPPSDRPYTILNKLTRQYVDPAEDLLIGTFLLESATRTYIDYHRLIAMAKEAIRSSLRGLFIEFIFHKNSLTVQLGYGFDPFNSSIANRPTESTMMELISRSGPSVITGNNSFGYFLRLNGFEHVVPLEHQQRQIGYRLSTHSTRMHADQRFNAILFSYPIERLRTHSVKEEALRITKAIEQFVQINKIKPSSSSSLSSVNSVMLMLLLFLSHTPAILYIYH